MACAARVPRPQWALRKQAAGPRPKPSGGLLLRSEEERRGNSEAVGFSDQPPPFIYDARSVISHPIEMNDLDCSELGFRGMGWTGPRKEGNFWVVFVFGSDLCLLAQFNV